MPDYTLKKGSLYYADPDSDLYLVGLDTDDGPEHPLYDKRVYLEVDEGLVTSIMELGVLMPIVITRGTIRRHGFELPNQTLVVAGRQRVKAAREANARWKAQGMVDKCVQVACVHRKVTTPMELMAALVAENEFRTLAELNDRIEKAMRLQSMGMPTDQIAKHFSCTPQTVRNWLALGKEGEVQQLVVQGHLLPSDGYSLARHWKAMTVAEREAQKAIRRGHRRQTKQRITGSATRHGDVLYIHQGETLRGILYINGSHYAEAFDLQDDVKISCSLLLSLRPEKEEGDGQTD